MAKMIDEVMTRKLRILPSDATVQEASRAMREDCIGTVLVMDDQQRLAGIVTDRDIVVRAIAEQKDPARTTLDEICSHEVRTLQPTATVEDAVRLMVEKGIRRVPIVQDGSPVGVVSLGDLAQSQDPRSALGAISAAPPDQ